MLARTTLRSSRSFSTTPRRLNSFKSPQDEKRERDRMYWTIGGIAALGAAVLWYANKEDNLKKK